MVKEQIEHALGESGSQLVKTNEEYGFEIYHLSKKDLPYQLLFTAGMSKNIQIVDKANEGLERIELYFALPPFWNMSTFSWPILWLNKIAQLPQKNKTWFGYGDTIPAGNPPEYLHDACDMNHFIISPPNYFHQEFSKDDFSEANFKMLAVMTLFQTEVDFKLRNSHTILFKKLKKKAINEILDTYRTSVCRKRILGMI